MTVIADCARCFEMSVRMPWRPLLLVWGVRPGRAHVEAAGGRIRAVFGFWTVGTDLANVERWELSGPYRWWRAIGLRSSWPFRDYTFGTSVTGGLTLTFRERVRFGRIFRAASLTVTVADLDGLAAVLAEGGIPGRDVRERPSPLSAGEWCRRPPQRRL